LTPFITLFVTSLAVALSQHAPAPAAQEPRLEMMTYQMVFLRKGTAPEPQGPEAQKVQQDHLARLAELNRQRLNVLYGPFADQDTSGLVGIVLFDVKDGAEAKRLMAEDPYVKSGALVMDVKPWMGPKGWFHEPPDRDVTHPNALEQLVFGILVSGPNRSQSQAEAEELQKGHLAYMEQLHQEGKLIAAGPFMEEGDMRGIVIYRVPSVEAAQQLASGDPMVKAGRLKLEAHPWMTLRGILK
jgi:uncharacterized protein YciI